jgi:hypothetical protein
VVEPVQGATRIGADEHRDSSVSTEELLMHLPSLAGGEAPGATDDGLTAACIRNIASDRTFAVWSIAPRDRTSTEGEAMPAAMPFNDINDIDGWSLRSEAVFRPSPRSKWAGVRRAGHAVGIDTYLPTVPLAHEPAARTVPKPSARRKKNVGRWVRSGLERPR